MVGDDLSLAKWGAASKMNTDMTFLEQLHDLGRRAAVQWLKAHRTDLGRRSTVDIDATFLSGHRQVSR
jgi:NTE family protein